MNATTAVIHHSDELGYSRKWQFSMRGLMFVTSVVAVYAALVGVSPVFAVALLPLILAAFVRTTRAPEGSGLFVTFCESLVVVVALIMVSAAAFALACVAGSLIVAGVSYRLCTPANGVVRASAKYVWRLVVKVLRDLQRWALRVKPDSIYDRVCAYSMTATVILADATRRLFRRCWYPEGSGC